MNYNDGINKVYNRYYHLFCEGELQKLVNNFKNVIIINEGYQKDNWYVILEKIN